MTKAMTDNYYSTHLIELVEQREPLSEELLKQSNINSRNRTGRNALYWAIKNQSKHNVSLLLNEKAKETQTDCTGCGFGQQTLCAMQEKN